VAVASGAAKPPPSDVLRVRLGGDDAETRIVLDLKRSASGRVEAGAPAKLNLVLKGVGAGVGAHGAGRGLVTAWAVTSSGEGARLALDVAPGATIERRFLIPPADGVSEYRYVVDLAAGPGRGLSPSASTRLASVAAAVTAAQARAGRLRKVIVIDAGHGGKDPGAAGAYTNEKDVTLATAEAVKSRLEHTGRYQVVMTRDADVFIPLEQRVQIARRAGADLFLSLHADSGGDPTTHGASVYTLSERGTSRVGYVLNRNDWFLQPAATGGDRAVGQILLDLSQRSTRNRSAVFAQMLISRVGDRAPLLERSHRDADYFVLLAPDVPAALLEMGFITNPRDEARLNDPGARSALAGQIAGAIDAYFGAQTRLASR